MKHSDNLRLVFTVAHICKGPKSPLPKKALFRLACKLNFTFHVLGIDRWTTAKRFLTMCLQYDIQKAANKGAAMRIIESHEGIIELPREQILVEGDIVLPDTITFGIGLSTNDDPDAPYLAVILTFYVEHSDKQNYTIVFREAPPHKPLEHVAVDGLTVLAWASNHDSDDPAKELLDLVANYAYTPLARVEIYQGNRWLDIWLVIGDWKGLYQVGLDFFKEKLGL